MNYNIYIERSAQKTLSKVPARDQSRIIESIQNLSDNPRPSSELEKAIIDNIQAFLFDSGSGLAFVARQKFISTEKALRWRM